MLIVGITGGIGSGKTTVCKIFELIGVPVFYADDEAKKIYNNKAIKLKVVKVFGATILNKNKEVDKKKLSEKVFNDKVLLAKLNAIIHPEVRKRFGEWRKKQKGKKYVIKEAAIMIESGAYKELDYLISINSPKLLRIKGIINKNILTISEIKKRMNKQISDKKRAEYSDVVITNDGKHSLIKQVLDLHKKLSRK
ncbi:MAG: dephospho-CoA kinase [Bacteroidetes bacterium]|nr:dephospho-CoA kinase [Bacteroidota bacterium]